MDCIEKIRFSIVKINFNSNNMNMNIWNTPATNVEMMKGQFESESSHERETAESQALDCIEKIRFSEVKMNLNMNMNIKYHCN